VEPGRVQAAGEASQLLNENGGRGGVAVLGSIGSHATGVDDDCDEDFMARGCRSRVVE